MPASHSGRGQRRSRLMDAASSMTRRPRSAAHHRGRLPPFCGRSLESRRAPSVLSSMAATLPQKAWKGAAGHRSLAGRCRDRRGISRSPQQSLRPRPSATAANLAPGAGHHVFLQRFRIVYLSALALSSVGRAGLWLRRAAMQPHQLPLAAAVAVDVPLRGFD